MSKDTDQSTRSNAQEALDSASLLVRAGHRRSAPSRWFGIAVALLIASLFWLYALENPYPYIVFPIVGMGLVATWGRGKNGAYGRDFLATKTGLLALASVVAVAVMVFIGTVYLRRIYDAPWVAIVAGLLVGVAMVLVNERIRRSAHAVAGRGHAG